MDKILGETHIYQPPLKRLRALGPKLALAFWGVVVLGTGALLMVVK